MPDPLDRLRNYGPETGYAAPLTKKLTPAQEWRQINPLRSPEEIERFNKKWEGRPNPAMPRDRTDRISNPYKMYPKPVDWDEEQPRYPAADDRVAVGWPGASGLWDPWGGGGAGGNTYVPQLGREMPEGREGYFNPWDDPPPTKENLDRIRGGSAPTPAEKFIRQNSNMTNQ